MNLVFGFLVCLLLITPLYFGYQFILNESSSFIHMFICYKLHLCANTHIFTQRLVNVRQQTLKPSSPHTHNWSVTHRSPSNPLLMQSIEIKGVKVSHLTVCKMSVPPHGVCGNLCVCVSHLQMGGRRVKRRERDGRKRSERGMIVRMAGERGGDPGRPTVLHLFKLRGFLDYLWQLILLDQ